MKTMMITIAGGLMLATAPAHAADPKAEADAARAAETSAPAPAARQTRYCVVDRLTGSHVPRRQCKSRADWMAQGFDPLAK